MSNGLTAADWATITTAEPMRTLVASLGEELEWRKDVTTAIPTGFDAWDNRLGGLYPAEVVSVVGEVGAGTSSLLLALANSALRGGHPVVYVCCERPVKRFVERMVAVRANVDELRLRTGHLDEKEQTRVQAAMDQVARLSIYPIANRQPSAIVEAVAGVNMNNEFASPLVIVDGYEEFVTGAPGRDQVLALRDAAHEMSFALVFGGRLRGFDPQQSRQIHEVPEDLAHYSDVVLALASNEEAWETWDASPLRLTVVKHRTADPEMTKSLTLERTGRYGWAIDQTADVSFARSLRPTWPQEN